MKLRELYTLNEDGAVNIQLLRMLTNIFINYYSTPSERTQLKKYNEYYMDGLATQFELENPFNQEYNQILDFLQDNNLEFLIDPIFKLKFYLDFSGYTFDSGDGKTFKADATYNSGPNVIKFYNIKSIFDADAVSHELRHMVQVFTYELERKFANKYRGKEEKEQSYYQQPVEKDAYWSGIFVSVVENYNIPYSNDTQEITNITKRIFATYKNRIGQENLTDKEKKHYYRKTAKALYGLALLNDRGVEIEIKDLATFVKQYTDSQENIIQNIISDMQTVPEGSKESRELTNKLNDALEDGGAFSINDIPGFESSREPNSSIFHYGNIYPPRRVSARGSNFNSLTTLLFLSLSKNKKMAQKYAAALERVSGNSISSMVGMWIGEFIEDEKNQESLFDFLANFYWKS